jgi:hypothetical protein
MGFLFFVEVLLQELLQGLLVVFGTDTIPNGACKGTRYNRNMTHFVLRPNPSSKRDEIDIFDEGVQEYDIETGEKDGIFYRICYLYPVILENETGTVTYFWEHSIFSLSVTIPRGTDIVETMLKHYGYDIEFENKLETEHTTDVLPPPLRKLMRS